MSAPASNPGSMFPPVGRYAAPGRGPRTLHLAGDGARAAVPGPARPSPIDEQAPCLAVDSLSPREREVARMVALGLHNAEVAYRLCISPRTVKVHVYNIFRKLGVRDRRELAGYALRIGIL